MTVIRLPFFDKLGSLRNTSVLGSIIAPLITPWLVPDPYMMTLVVTRRCNARCRMCNLWQQGASSSLSLKQIDHIFTRNDFSFVRSVTLTGGEPTLREDLPSVLNTICRSCPNLAHVLLATNGLHTRRIVDHVTKMMESIAAERERIRRFDVQISLDGVGDVHDEMRGIEGAFERVENTLDQLALLQRRFHRLGVRLSSIVTPLNLSHIPDVYRYALHRGLEVSFSPVVLSDGYYQNLQTAHSLIFSDVRGAQLFERLSNVIESPLRFYYKDIGRMLRGMPRSRRCMMGFYGFVLEHDGQVYPCVNCERCAFGNLLTQSYEEVWFGSQATDARWELRRDCCPTCMSMCYPLPANAAELLKIGWRRIWPHSRSQLSDTNVDTAPWKRMYLQP